MKITSRSASGLLTVALLVGCGRQCQSDGQSIQERERMMRFQQEVRATLDRLADQTVGGTNVCPVHHVSLSTQSVDMVYGLIRPARPEPTPDLRTREFPYATKWVAAGCIMDESFPKKAKVLQCVKCLSEQEAWYVA